MNLERRHPWPEDAPPAKAMCGEAERFKVLASYGFDELEGDEELGRIVRFAANLCGAPIATVSLVEQERQRFLAREGLAEAETPRSTSICAHTMLGGELLEVLDATRDERFAGFEIVTGAAHLRYYAGMPLVSPEGAPIGALCVIDNEVHDEPLTPLQVEGLAVLAQAVMRRLSANRERIAASEALDRSEGLFRQMADCIPDLAWTATSDFVFDFYNQRWREFTGSGGPEGAEGWRAIIHPDDVEKVIGEWYDKSLKGMPFEKEFRMRTASGDYRWMLSRGVPVTHEDGTIDRWFGTLTDIDEGHRLSESRELLAGELSHRIKNIFAVISGLVSLRTRGNPELEKFGREINETVRALGRAQEFVRPLDSEKGDELVGLLEVLMAPYQNGAGDRVSITGDKVEIGSRVATPMALVFHELATNAAKYGALSDNNGRISLDIKRTGDTVVITWQERDGPSAALPDRQGFGGRLIDTAVMNQLGGAIDREWDSGGLRLEIALPLERVLP